MEADQRAARTDFDLRDLGRQRIQLHPHQREQVLCRVGQIAEAVDQFGGEAFDGVHLIDLVDPAIEAHAQGKVRHVEIRNGDRRIDGDLRAELLGRSIHAHVAGFCGDDRLFEHRLVEFEANLLDVTGLLIANEIARAANVEIVAGELEARTQAIEV